MMKRPVLAALASAGVAAVAVLAVLTFPSSDQSTGVGDASSAAPAPDVDAAETVASRVVEAMYSFDYRTAGPNAWLDKVHEDLTPAAYAYYRQVLGPGPGSTDSPFWRQLASTGGHQLVTAEGARPDPEAEATNSDTHVTLMVPFEVDAAGIDSPLEHGDRLVFVNLDRGSVSEPWQVAAVMPTTGLLPGYPTRALTPEPEPTEE